MENYCLLTDTTAELTPALAQELDVEVIPMPLVLDGVSYQFTTFDDKLSVSDFYNQLRAGKFAHTSQINETVYQEFFEKYLKKGIDVLYFCFSSGMSNTYHIACQCIEELRKKYPERRIECLDTLCASVGEGLLVFSAAKMRLAGSSLDEVLQWATDHRDSVCHSFKVDELEHLRRGGRISNTTAVIGSALQIKPILVVDHEGKLQVIAKVRGRKRARDYLMKIIERHLLHTKEAETVFIGHGDCQEEAESLAEDLKANLPSIKRIIIVPLGPIIGAHVGPGMIDLIFYGDDRMCSLK
ncbi:MAG: DegV family protein [Oscillospiraceae bacterium]|nr:DegV family protein [Oscillospiraceae bacterium]